MTYADAKLRAVSMISDIEAGKMPPWGAQDTAECKPRFPWQHDLRVTPTELKTLKDWVDADRPEGDPADAPKAGAAPTLALTNVDATVKPDKPYVASGLNDQMRCFLIDPKLTERKYLNGIQVIAGNPLVVHHVLVFADPQNEGAKLADADGQYDCFGGVGLQNPKLIEAWAPGGVPLEFPPNVGTPLDAGTHFVMQVHYHPAGAKAADPDLTQVQLRFTKEVPEWTGASVLIGNFPQAMGNDGLLPGEDDPVSGPAFIIPPGKAAHVESMRFTVPSSFGKDATGKAIPTPDLHIYGVGTHMHYVGRDMKIWAERAFAKAPCTAAQLGPVQACTDKNCPGAAGGDLISCAQSKCATEAAALAGTCGDCITQGVVAGQQVSAIATSCQQIQAKPANITDPASECFVQTPEWDFNWQRIYNYAKPIEELPILRAGDALNMRCTYDNTLNNPFVKIALGLKNLAEPVQVKLGETTLDEMCLSILQVVFKAK